MIERAVSIIIEEIMPLQAVPLSAMVCWMRIQVAKLVVVECAGQAAIRITEYSLKTVLATGAATYVVAGKECGLRCTPTPCRGD